MEVLRHRVDYIELSSGLLSCGIASRYSCVRAIAGAPSLDPMQANASGIVSAWISFGSAELFYFLRAHRIASIESHASNCFDRANIIRSIRCSRIVIPPSASFRFDRIDSIDRTNLAPPDISAPGIFVPLQIFCYSPLTCLVFGWASLSGPNPAGILRIPPGRAQISGASLHFDAPSLQSRLLIAIAPSLGCAGSSS